MMRFFRNRLILMELAAGIIALLDAFYGRDCIDHVSMIEEISILAKAEFNHERWGSLQKDQSIVRQNIKLIMITM